MQAHTEWYGRFAGIKKKPINFKFWINSNFELLNKLRYNRKMIMFSLFQFHKSVIMINMIWTIWTMHMSRTKGGLLVPRTTQWETGSQFAVVKKVNNTAVIFGKSKKWTLSLSLSSKIFNILRQKPAYICKTTPTVLL